MDIIEDGKGSGYKASVDLKNRLHAGVTGRSERDAAINDERAFLFGSTVIDYTVAPNGSGLADLANYEPVLVIKNTSNRDLVVSNIFVSIGESAGGTGSAYFTVWKNATDNLTTPATDIFVQASDCPVSNMDVASAEGFEGVAYIGDGSTTTFSGGTAIHTTIIPPSLTNIVDVDIPLKISKDQNIFFTLVPPASNTSIEIMLATTVYYVDSELPS